MDIRKEFKQYYTRLMWEAFFKALMLGLMLGFAANLLFMTFSLLFMLKIFWVGFVIWGGVSLIAVPLLFVRLKPTERAVARRMDALGLQERVVTMNEYKLDQTEIASLQRKDTYRSVERVNANLLKFALSIPLIIVFAVVAALSLSMSTITTLAATGVIETPGGDNGGGILPNPNDEPEIKYYTITYNVQGKGMIEGQIFQVVEEGEDAEPVLAVPDDEYGFFVWLEDGSEEPYRQEFKVVEDLTFTAVFKPGQPGDPSPDGDPTDGDEGEESDDAQDKPDESQEGSQNDPHQQTTDPSSGAGGQYDEINQVIDGQTYYGDVYDNAKQEMIDDLSESDEYSSDEEEVITDYFEIIKK